MKRAFISFGNLEIYDKLHILQPDGSFIVDTEKDGQTLEQHRQGIEYIKEVIKSGKKTLPILVTESVEEAGKFIRLDGFKRCLAYKELGYKHLEAFICSFEEYYVQKDIPYGDGVMKCWHGGQFKEIFPLVEAGEAKQDNYGNTIFLYKDDNKPHGLRIEVSECIHVHWGEFGRYRLAMGRRDFLELAEAMSHING